MYHLKILGPGVTAYTLPDWLGSENFVLDQEKYKRTGFPHFFFSNFFGDICITSASTFAGQKQIFIHLQRLLFFSLRGLNTKRHPVHSSSTAGNEKDTLWLVVCQRFLNPFNRPPRFTAVVFNRATPSHHPLFSNHGIIKSSHHRGSSQSLHFAFITLVSHVSC